MKRVFQSNSDLAALVLRLGFGFFIVFGHGLGKLEMVLAGNFQFPALFGLSPAINLVLAMLAEFVAGIMVLIGLRTRLASIPIMITMLVAVLAVHLNDPLFAGAAQNGSKEFALLFFFGFLGTFLLGSGRYSVDAIARR
ncbi:MAG: DoxX family protein [Marinilabiliaceae bacterium]